MKKLLLLFAFTSTIFAASAQTDLFFSEYIEGSGNNKALEIYNPTSETIDLTSYIVVRFSNGEAYPANLDPKTTSGGYLELKGTLAPGKCHVIVNGQTEDNSSSPACDPEMQKLATQLDKTYPAPTYMNGNDAIGLLKLVDGNYIPVDIFGEMGLLSTMKNSYGWSYVQDSTLNYKMGDVEATAEISNYVVPLKANDGSTSGPFWMAWTKDHSLIRKPFVVAGVTSNPSPFNIAAEWDTLPAVNQGDTAWSYQDIWTNLGIHDCVVGVKERTANTQNISIFPNPVTNNTFTVNSIESKITSIEVYSVIGRMIYAQSGEFKESVKLSLDNPTKGVYMVKIELLNNTTLIKKIIID